MQSKPTRPKGFQLDILTIPYYISIRVNPGVRGLGGLPCPLAPLP